MKASNALFSAVLFGLMACGNTADGVKKDAGKVAEKTGEVAGNAAEEAAKTAAEAKAQVSGALQTGEIKTAIMADTRVSAADINVDTDQDKKTVTLRGSVKTAAEKKLAGEIATDKAIGYSIVNNLSIKP
jgi:osmotically-inducible protein OsmY